LVPRAAYAVFRLEVPGFSRKEREQGILNRLRGEYPSAPEEQPVVVLPNGRRSVLAVVFKEADAEDPRCLSTLAARRICRYVLPGSGGERVSRRKGVRYCVCAVRGWIEYLVCDGGAVVSSAVAGWDGEGLDAVLAASAGDYFGAPEELRTVEVLCEVPREDLRAGFFWFRFWSLETALRKISRGSYACFPGRLPGVRRRRYLLGALSCCAAVGVAAMCRDWYGERQAAWRAGRERERQEAAAAAQRETERQQLAELARTWEETAGREPVTVYETLELVAACFDSGVRIGQATIGEGSFQIEGTAPDALRVLKRLAGHGRTECRIHTIVREGTGERFTVTGELRAGRSGRTGLSSEAAERAFYEAGIAGYRAKQAVAARDAAAAGEAVVRLLEGAQCRVIRVRYLEAAGGWTLEATVRTGGEQLVRLAEAAAAERQPFRLTSLQTRVRDHDIEAVATFFVRGPGGAGQEGDYEAHPPAGRIAALYEPFRPARADPPQAVAAEPEPPGAAGVRSGVSRPPDLEYVGFIGTGEGARCVYVKDTRSGDLLRLTEGADHYGYRRSGAGAWFATIDGTVYEVRRSDGF
jgi:hypothetical protein